MFRRPKFNLQSAWLLVLFAISIAALTIGLRVTRADSGLPTLNYPLRLAPGLTASSPSVADCIYSLSPTNQTFAGVGASNSVSVTTDSGCAWTAVSNDSWITINSGANGSGNGAVGYTVSSNSGALRTGTLTIAGQTFNVTQAASGSSAYFNLEPFAVQSEVDAGRLIDFDSDGDLDLILVQAAANWAPRATLAYRNDGQGHYSDVTNTVLTTSVTTEAPGEAKLWAADFNNDGKMDIFIPDGGPDTSPYPGGQSRILVQSNDGHLVDETATRLPQIRSFAHSAAVADIDGDGDLDIFIGNVNNNIGNGLPAVGPRFYINDGTGHFTSRIDNLPAWVATVVYPNPQFSGSLLIDVNNDNFPDLVLGPQRIQGGVIDTTRDIVLLNDGHGDFQTVAPSTSMPLRANGPDGLSLQFTSADFNGDGLADILYTSQSGTSDAGNKLILYLNNGNATFFDASDRIPQGSGLCYHSEPVDINSDNRMDFVCRSSPGQIPRLFVNMGQAQFIEQTSLIGNSVPYGRIYGGDVDGDGDKDLVMTAPNQSAVARNLQPILINQGCSVSLSPPSQSFGSAGGTGSVGLTTGAGCNWMASADADWIHVTSNPTTGTGNTTVNFSVDANNGAARSSKLIIGGQNFTITQSGVSTFTVSGHVSTVNGPLAGVSVYLNVNNVSTRLATTDANGLYQFTQVSAGTYTITAAKDGYLFDSPTVTVSNADQTNVDVHAASNVFGQPPAQDYFLDFSPSANNDQRAAIAPQSALLNLTSEFSMEVWIYRKGAAPFCDIMGKTAVNPGDPFRSYSLTFDDTGTKIAFVQTTGQSGSYRAAGSSTPLPLNTWTHVAGTLKNGTLRLYINGVEVAFNSSAGPSNNSTNPFSLGGGVRNGMVAEATLPSRLRQARVWSRALTPFDLYYNSSRNLGGNESGLIAYWKLDEGQGQIAHDSTANHLDLQLGVTPNVDANDPQWVDVNGCGYSLSPGSQTFGAGGGNSTVNVTSPNGCNWTAASNDSWITINSGASGSGNGSVGYSVAANSGASRTGTMTIAGQTFTVNQSGSPGVVQLSSATYSVNEGAGSLVVTVNRTNGTSGSVSVGYFTGGGNASVGADYTFTGGTLTFGDGETSKTFSIPINEDNAVEGNETFSVTLNNPNGGVGIGAISTAIVTIVDNDSCAFSLNPSSQSFTSAGGTGIVNVTTNPGCSASATSNDSWITVTSVGTDSNGSGEVRYSVAANPNSNPRTGTINISGQSYTVNEGGISCAFSLNPTGESIGPSGGNISVSVMAAASDCNWTAINNNPEFLTITSGTSGTGNGTVTLSVAPNTGSTSRTGTLTLAGQPFTVTQAASAMTVQFSASTASATETANATTNVDLVVTRTGDTTAPATVNYASSDGTASERSDYLAALGTLHFAAGETSKTITVFIVDDAFGEGPETFSVTLSNPVGCTPGSPSVLTVTINSDESANGPNPVRDASFNTDFFVRQHYIDFFNREADAPGLAFWKNQIDECTTQACRDIRKINVSAAFFLSIEFQQTGYLVYKANQASFNSGEFLKLRDFLPDTQEIGRGVVIGQPGADAQLEANKQKFFLDFVQRSKFLDPAAYPTTMTAAQFVDKLNANTFDPRNTGSGGALSSSERDALVSQLSANPSSPALRAQVLRSVSENSLFNNRQFNKAFVSMQYFGYLRRNPNDPPEAGLDFGGYNFWLGKLNQFNGNFVNAEMVKAFIVSGEYQGRFGP